MMEAAIKAPTVMKILIIFTNKGRELLSLLLISSSFAFMTFRYSGLQHPIRPPCSNRKHHLQVEDYLPGLY